MVLSSRNMRAHTTKVHILWSIVVQQIGAGRLRFCRPAMETINSNPETGACLNEACSCECICVVGQARQVWHFKAIPQILLLLGAMCALRSTCEAPSARLQMHFNVTIQRFMFVRVAVSTTHNVPATLWVINILHCV